MSRLEDLRRELEKKAIPIQSKPTRNWTTRESEYPFGASDAKTITVNPHIPTVDWVPRLWPDFKPPYHLGPMLEALDDLPGSKRRIVVAIPVRHGKTTAVGAAIVKWLIENPKLQIVYASYGAQFSQRQNRLFRRLYESAGGEFGELNTIQQWETYAGGGVLATSVDGPLIGHGANILVIDDPIKSRQDAESNEIRELVDEWVRDVAITRLTHDGAAILVASRWHPDDPSGRMIARGAEHIHLKAIDDEGNALWPEVRPLDYLLRTREEIGEYGFASQYQGEPIPRTGALFGPPTFCDFIPEGTFRRVLGVDLAYSAGSRSDYSAFVHIIETGGRFYVQSAEKLQSTMPAVEARLSQVPRGVPIASYVAGPERGVLDLLLQKGISIHRIPAKYNKFVRCQKTAAAWNSGRIVVPNYGKWAEEFIGEVCHFTGSDKDTHDDLVDALVSGYDFLAGTAPVEVPGDKWTLRTRCL